MSEIEKIAALLAKRNEIDLEISKIIDRPSLAGHIGEYIASKILKIKLADSTTAKGFDGIFSDGPLMGKTVNIKIYGKREGLLDISPENLADYYLVLTGPKLEPVTSRGSSRPLVISNVYLFEMTKLVKELRERGVKIGVATSVAKHLWEEAEIYPHKINDKLELLEEQVRRFKLFATH